jgi:hypothetical protein
MDTRSLRHAAVVFASAFALAFQSSPASSDIVGDWNAQVDELATRGANNTAAARTAAILHVAIFEAVNAVESRYSPYRLQLKGTSASAQAAAAAAGYEVLVALHPEQRDAFQATLVKGLADVPKGMARDQGITLGKEAAAGILALRQHDGSDTKESYRPFTTPGVYVPTATVVNSSGGAVTPWVMQSGSQFRPAPPPALNSPTWTRDVNEVREMGSLSSVRRTPGQTDTGRFWFLTGVRSYNPLVRQFAQGRNLDLVDSARVFALVAMAAADAGTAVFDAKYTYNFWRPITAIRNADQTGNAATAREASWIPLGDTPMHPEYPCAHCITSSSVVAVLLAAVGEQSAAITMSSPSTPGVTRRWTRLQEYADEVSDARIWAGFHYRFSTEIGKDMGRQIGQLTVATQLLPLRR